MAVIGAVEPIVGYAKMAELAAAGAEDAAVSLDSRFFIFPLLAGILLSAFSALFVGAEYSGGTIRNKLVTGRSKAAVYDEWGRDAAGMLPNPNYLQPVPRAVCRFPIDLLPTGQCLQISVRSAEQFWRMPLLSLSAIAASTCAGLLLFRRKDLK